MPAAVERTERVMWSLGGDGATTKTQRVAIGLGCGWPTDTDVGQLVLVHHRIDTAIGHDVCRRGERRQTLRAGIAYDTDTPLGYHTLRRVETHHLVGVLSRGERQTQLANTFRLLSPGLQAGRAVAD